MWDLTVPGNNDHDFYVLALTADPRGQTYVGSNAVPVLVHNDSCPVSREEVADGLGTRSTGDPTLGQVVRDVGGGSVVKVGGEVASGTSDQSAAIDSYLGETLPEEEYPSAGMHPAATHVETRAAWFMRNGGPDSMELVINNAGGACEGVFSCSNVIPQILRAGQKMTVWSPDGQGGVTSTSFEGGG